MTAMALSLQLQFDGDHDGVNTLTSSSSVPRPSNNINRCSAMAMEGWIIINEGGRYIVNDIPIVWARWPTHDSIIIVRGRALIVVVVVLLFEGGIVDVVDELQLLLAVVDLNQRVD